MRESYLEKLTLQQLRRLIVQLDPLCKLEDLERRGINRKNLINRVKILKPDLQHNAEFYLNLEKRISTYVEMVSRLRVLSEIHHSRYTQEDIMAASQVIKQLYDDYKRNIDRGICLSKQLFLYSIAIRDDTPLNSGEGLVALVDELRESDLVYQKKPKKQLMARVMAERYGSLAYIPTVVGAKISAIVTDKHKEVIDRYLERFANIKTLPVTKAICLMQDMYSMYQRINLHQNVNILAFEEFLIEIVREIDEDSDLLTILKNINDDSDKFPVSSAVLKKFYGRHASNQQFLGKYTVKSPEKLYLVISIRGEKVVIVGGYITYKSAKHKVAEMLNVDISTVTRRNASEIDSRIVLIKNFKDNMIR